MSCVAGCPTCAPAKPACAARSRRSTPSSPTVSCTSNSPTTLTASSPSCATRPTCPASRSANACCGWSSKTSSSAPTRSPSVTASRSATPTPATPTPRPSPPRRATIARVIHCVGGVLSPLLSNVALSVLDEHIARAPGGPTASPYQRAKRRAHGLPNYRLARYADDWCLMIPGTRADAEALREETAEILSTIGLRLSPEKTLITHIDEGLDFLGWHIQRHRKKGTNRHYVYSYPSKKALAAVKDKVRALCRQDVNLPLAVLLHRLNRMLRGWTAYFRFGVSHATFQYLRAFTWRQVIGWLRRKHRRSNWKDLRRRHCRRRWWPADGEVMLFDPAKVRTIRYRYRGAAIPSPWPSTA